MLKRCCACLSCSIIVINNIKASRHLRHPEMWSTILVFRRFEAEGAKEATNSLEEGHVLLDGAFRTEIFRKRSRRSLWLMFIVDSCILQIFANIGQASIEQVADFILAHIEIAGDFANIQVQKI